MLVINKKAFCLYLTFKMFACLNEMFYGYTGDLDIIYMDIKKGDLDNRGCKLQGKISSQALNKNFFTLKFFRNSIPYWNTQLLLKV